MIIPEYSRGTHVSVVTIQTLAPRCSYMQQIKLQSIVNLCLVKIRRIKVQHYAVCFGSKVYFKFMPFFVTIVRPVEIVLWTAVGSLQGLKMRTMDTEIAG